MATWTGFDHLATLLDVTVPNIGPGVTVKSASQGSYSPTAATTIEITPNTIDSTSIPNGMVGDGYQLEIVSPVDANGSTPDVQITFEVDGKDLSDYISIDGSADGNMFPRIARIDGHRYVKLGHSTRDLLRKIVKGQRVSNLPLLITGLKITSGVKVKVYSNAGWGQSGAAVTPLRVVLKGDLLQESDILPLSGFFQANASAFYSQPPVIPVQIPGLNIGGLSQSTWAALPGGVKQAGTKIMRRLLYAYNNNATKTNGLYIFSQNNNVQGSNGQVVDDHHDLGFDFSENKNALIIHEFGVRLAEATAGNQAFVGWKINGEVVPQDTPQGTPISYQWNDFEYGLQAPQGNKYLPLPEASKLVKLVVQGNAAVPFISTAGTSVIAAGNAVVAVGGVLIERS